MDDYYLKANKAPDLKDKKERIIFRIFEILPGFLSWATLFLAIFLSWFKPLWVAIFIIAFVIFWLLRTIYYSLHLRAGYRKMKEYKNINWFKKLNQLPVTRYQLPVESWRQIFHLIVFPMYKEPLEIIKDSFQALVNTDYSKDKMIVVLACEKRASETIKETVSIIEKEFGPKFFKFLVTFHPKDIPGEIAGKSSNETWAVKKVKELIIDPRKIPYQNIIFSSLDADTKVFPKYFSCLTYHYLTTEKPTRTSFQPTPLFINNIWQAPGISRVFSFFSAFWHIINQQRPEKLITFSSHSMSFKALVDVGFKQTNVVSDDSRIFWQCFLKFDGEYKVQPIFYPVSMDANVSKNLLRTLINIYKQQRRWAYGVGDIPYFLFGFLKNKKIPISKKISLGFELIEGHWSWATASILIFLLGWLPLILGGERFNQTLLSYNLPLITRNILTFSMIGLIFSIYFSLNLLPPESIEYGKIKYFLFAFQWFWIPLTMIIFVSLPALDAQTRLMLARYMGFWPTEKFRK
jgi:hypothetical protein